MKISCFFLSQLQWVFLKHVCLFFFLKISQEKLEWNVESKVGSLKNVDHVPGGGNVSIPKQHLDFKEKAHSKVGSLEGATVLQFYYNMANSTNSHIHCRWCY